MGCGCGGARKVQYSRYKGVRAQKRPIVNVKKGVQASRKKLNIKCPRCSWPMASISRYDMKTRKKKQLLVCTNRSCRYRKSK
jgi:hypothetical protein